MFPPKSRVRYAPTDAQARPALILAKVKDLDAYVIRLACGRKLTVHASQLRANPASQIQPKIER